MIKPLPYFIPIGLLTTKGHINCVVYCCFPLEAVIIPVESMHPANLKKYLPPEEWDSNIREEVKQLKKDCYKNTFIKEDFVTYLNNIDQYVFHNALFTNNIKKHLAQTIIILKSLFWGERSSIPWSIDYHKKSILFPKNLFPYSRIKRLSRLVSKDEKYIYIPIELINDIKNYYHLELPENLTRSNNVFTAK